MLSDPAQSCVYSLDWVQAAALTDRRTARRETATGTLRAELLITKRDQVGGCIGEEERAQDVIHYGGLSARGASPEKWIPAL